MQRVPLVSTGCGCCANVGSAAVSRDRAVQRALWWALGINLAMFAVEVASGAFAHSASLLADASDFLGDVAAYAITLIVLPRGPRLRAGAALVKGAGMALFGLGVLAYALWHALTGVIPHAPTMSVVGVLALIANFAVAWILFRYRGRDVNMRSVWVCTRNDVIGNLGILVAALGVFRTGAGWPDAAVAGIIALLALSGGLTVVFGAWREFAASRQRFTRRVGAFGAPGSRRRDQAP